MKDEQPPADAFAPSAVHSGSQPQPPVAGASVRTVYRRIAIEYRLFDDLPIAAFIPRGRQGDRFRALLDQIAAQSSAEPLDHPVVLIAPDVASAVSRLHETMQQYQKEDRRPLAAIVTRHPTRLYAEQADLLLPWSDEWCRYHLRRALKNSPPPATACDDLNILRSELELFKTAIVHNISHELRTPLLQIKSAVSQMTQALPDDAFLNQLSDYAGQAVGRLEGLVSRVIRIARGIEIQPQPTLPGDVLNLALRQISTSWEHRSKIDRLNPRIDPDLPLIMGDKQALGVLLEQLIDNALKFSDGAVDITVQSDPAGVRFTVADSGIGIAPDERSRIFDLFYQTDRGANRCSGGAGIGLALAERIAARHNTVVEVSSEIGRGSAFSFVVSAAQLF